MEGFRLFATPWWVNLIILVPVLSFYFWRRNGVALGRTALAAAAMFGLAFGFVEAAVVVYLHAALGLPAGSDGMLAYAPPLEGLPRDLLVIEMLREAATIAMLAALALLAAQRARERWAIFLYAFAIWDLAYYAGLWATVRWPPSLLADDILFLLPVPWVSEVWYPVLVSGLTVLAVVVASGIAHRARRRLTLTPLEVAGSTPYSMHRVA